MEDPLQDLEWEEHHCEDCGKVTQHLTSTSNEERGCAPCALEKAKVRANMEYCNVCLHHAKTVIDGVCNTCRSKLDEADNINWPKHYNAGQIQPIDVIEDWKLDFRLANAVKYIARHQHKGKAKEDLEKAVWYINRYIEKEFGE